jgi:hypothetical protein
VVQTNHLVHANITTTQQEGVTGEPERDNLTGQKAATLEVALGEDQEAVTTPQMTINPVSMDATTQEQGNELQEVMRLFRETTTTPLSSFVLQTPLHPLHKNSVLATPDVEKATSQGKKRESSAQSKTDQGQIYHQACPRLGG